MSQLKVDSIVNLSGSGSPELTNGVTLPATKLISGAGGLNITGISTVAQLTATSITATSINVASSGNLNVTGVVTATSFVGSGSGLYNLPSTGSFYFNSGISVGIAYSTTTSLSTVYTSANTASSSFLIHSIQVTNPSGIANVSVDASMYGSNRYVAYNIPVPAGSSVELLRKPKVLPYNDVLKMRSNISNTLNAVITVEEVLNNTSYVGTGVSLSSANTYSDLYTNAVKFMVESIVLVNVDNFSDVKATVAWANTSNVIQSYFAYDIIIPFGSSVEIIERPKFIPATNKVRVLASESNRLNAIIAARILA